MWPEKSRISLELEKKPFTVGFQAHSAALFDAGRGLCEPTTPTRSPIFARQNLTLNSYALVMQMNVWMNRRMQTLDGRTLHPTWRPRSTNALTLSDFVRRPVNKNVERPHHARDGDDVEGDRAHDLPPLTRCHLELLPLLWCVCVCWGADGGFEGKQKTNKLNIKQSRLVIGRVLSWHSIFTSDKILIFQQATDDTCFHYIFCPVKY